MSRIKACFDQLKTDGRKALIPFVTAGDPNPNVTVPLMHAMVNAGASIIELGVPFSDPMADGPVIQKAAERALEHHTGMNDVMDMVRQFREKDNTTPVVLMGYLNPIEVMGYQIFAEKCADAGVDGVLTVDSPPEESDELIATLSANAVDLIYLLAPTSSKERIEKITAAASGFVYYVAIKGVTGAAHLDLQSVADKMAEIRAITDLPLGVGFGIKDADTARSVAGLADAVVVGSALVTLVGKYADQPDKINQAVADVLSSMRTAMDA